MNYIDVKIITQNEEMIMLKVNMAIPKFNFNKINLLEIVKSIWITLENKNNQILIKNSSGLVNLLKKQISPYTKQLYEW